MQVYRHQLIINYKMIFLKKAFSNNFKSIKFQSAKNSIITMSSPQDLNCLSSAMKKDLVDALRSAQADPNVKTVTLISDVPKAFCAGADIKDFVNKTSKDFLCNDIFQQLAYTFANAKKPIIAGVNGVALGGGFQLALLCDVLICSKEARFGLPQIKLGLIPGIGGTQRFPRIVGKTNAMRYILTGDFISSGEALAMGIVSRVVQSQALHKQTLALAQKIASFGGSTLIKAKAAVKLSQQTALSQGVKQQRLIFYPLFDTQSAKEGVSAFVEKRTAKFQDK